MPQPCCEAVLGQLQKFCDSFKPPLGWPAAVKLHDPSHWDGGPWQPPALFEDLSHKYAPAECGAVPGATELTQRTLALLARRDPNVCAQVAGTKWCGDFCGNQCPPYPSPSPEPEPIASSLKTLKLNSTADDVPCDDACTPGRAPVSAARNVCGDCPACTFSSDGRSCNACPAGKVSQPKSAMCYDCPPVRALPAASAPPSPLRSPATSTFSGQVRLGRRLRLRRVPGGAPRHQRHVRAVPRRHLLCY